MGWKGTARSIGAAVRAAERDSRRRQRELEKEHKNYEKMQALQQAIHDVSVYENHIDVICSIHKECSEVIDWESISDSKVPIKPELSSYNENLAREKSKSYKPNFFDKLFKRESKLRAELYSNIEKSIELDKIKNKQLKVDWENNKKQWNENIDFAKAVISGNYDKKIAILKQIDPFSEISNLGSNIDFFYNESGLFEVSIHVHGSDIIPKQKKALLQSGKLSSKTMTKGQFYEIYQDYVCSTVLRVANEVFSVFLDEMVIVTAVDDLLNSQTGHLELEPILSVAIPRKTLKSLNLELIDPSDSMNNFVFNMDFKKTLGFKKVSRIDCNSLNHNIKLI